MSCSHKLSVLAIESECFGTSFEIVGHVNFLSRVFMRRCYVLRKKAA